MNIGIVGLGMIGGSLAKCLHAHTEHAVFGWDTDVDTMYMAKMTGAIVGTLNNDTMSTCAFIFIAVPPVALTQWVEDHAAHIPATCTLVDLCGVKRDICNHIAPLAKTHGFSYIGGHPMAGREVFGFANASCDLYKGASMILTPDEDTDISRLEALKTLFLSIGFDQLVFADPDKHDAIIAYTSQLAHITSSAYIKSPTAQKQFGYSAGSYKDMTRVAKLDENLWTELFMANTDHLTEELRSFIGRLNEYLTALEAHDADAMRDLLREGRLLKAMAGGE